MSDFHTYFDPTWGQFKGKIRPTTGNHEYKTGSPCVTKHGQCGLITSPTSAAWPAIR